MCGYSRDYIEDMLSRLTSLGCKKAVITGISFDNSLLALDTYAFYGDKSLKLVSLGSNLSRIDDYAFYGCSALMSAGFDEGLDVIGVGAFWGCSSLGKHRKA